MKQLQLRIPPDVHERVKAASVEDRRSLNGELLWLIEVGLEQRLSRR